MQALWPAWQRAARELTGKMTVGAREPGAPHLCALVDDVIVEAGVAGTGVTWLLAEAPLAGRLRCAVSPLANFPLARSFELDLGGPGPGDRLTVRTDDAPLARVWLAPRALRERLERAGDYHLVIEGGTVRAFTRAPEGDADRLVAAACAVAAMARRGPEIRRRWREVARQLGGHLASGSAGPAQSVAVPVRGVTVRVDGFAGGLAPRRSSQGLFVRVSCARTGPADDSFAIHDADGRRSFLPSPPAELVRTDAPDVRLDGRYSVWASDPDLATSRLDAVATDRLLAAAPQLVLAQRSALTVFFQGFEVAAARLRAAVDLAALLALDQMPAGLAAPYR